MPTTGTKMALEPRLNATEFRANLFQYLESAANGTPVSIQYKGREYQLMALATKGKLDSFYAAGEPEELLADPQDMLFSDDPALKKQREEEWAAKWDNRLTAK
jgi:hypothetical protein